MTTMIQRFADRVLARFVPEVEVAAGCSYLQTCRCEGYVRFQRRCYSGCGIPTHCGPCNIATRC